ncbi:TetR family transcriptional regulator C-terminal domain-containing protein [Nonomuraea salmonea]|uniref:TetR family transcriptional regulator C-terminal domain-containing protein n=1 Tax=Nonomuraea salmonea TaxID=46181 RepID=UPI003CD08241
MRDAVESLFDAWRARLLKEIGRAVAAGELPESTDQAGLAFELTGLAMALNHAIQLHRDPEAAACARRAFAARLGDPAKAGGDHP